MSKPKCPQCKIFMPFAEWDGHQSCPCCRQCSGRAPCTLCQPFSLQQWGEIEAWIACRQGGTRSWELKKAAGKEAAGHGKKSGKCGSRLSRSATSRADQLVSRDRVDGQGALSTSVPRSRVGLEPAALPRDPVAGATDPLLGAGPSGSVHSEPRDQVEGATDPGESAGPSGRVHSVALSVPAVRSRVGPGPGVGPGAGPGAGPRDPVVVATGPGGSAGPDGFVHPVPSQPVGALPPQSLIPLVSSSSEGGRRSKDRKRRRRRRRYSDSESSSGSSSRRRRRKRRASNPGPLAELAALFRESSDRQVAALESLRGLWVRPVTADPGISPGIDPGIDPGFDGAAVHSVRDDRMEVCSADSLEPSDYGGPSTSALGVPSNRTGAISGPSGSGEAAQGPDLFSDFLGSEFPPEAGGDVRAPSHRDDAQSEADPEEGEPLRGATIPKEAFEKAVEVLRRLLGFGEQSAPPPDPSSRVSRLSLHHTAALTAPTMPVDAESFERIEGVFSSGVWQKTQAQGASWFRQEDGDMRTLFTPPRIPQAAVTASKASSSKVQEEWKTIDTVARSGLRFASASLLVADVVSRAFSQEEEISWEDAAPVVNLLGPLVRQTFDHLAKISIRSVMSRRRLLLEPLGWPQEVVAKFMALPVLGEDLFDGQFEELLQAESKRHREVGEASFRVPRKPGFPRGGRGKSSRQGSKTPAPRDRSGSAGGSRRPFGGSSRRGRRGPARGGGRGFGRQQYRP